MTAKAIRFTLRKATPGPTEPPGEGAKAVATSVAWTARKVVTGILAGAVLLENGCSRMNRVAERLQRAWTACALRVRLESKNVGPIRRGPAIRPGIGNMGRRVRARRPCASMVHAQRVRHRRCVVTAARHRRAMKMASGKIPWRAHSDA